jgi:PPM family protein phosphatase
MVFTTRVEEARRGRGEDRIAVVHRDGCTLVAVADGAGGVTGGAYAAEAICLAVEACDGNENWVDWLSRRDKEIRIGLAAAVVMSVSGGGMVRGASVGDCEAWLFGPKGGLSLTSGQKRKPLLGSGEAVPSQFVASGSGQTLVVATDGLWKYIAPAYLAVRPLEVCALVDGARLRGGGLQDDVAVAVCEM